VLAGITEAGKLGRLHRGTSGPRSSRKAELLAVDDVTHRARAPGGLLVQELQVLEVGTQIRKK